MSRRNSNVLLLCSNKRNASSRLGDTSREYCQNTSLHGFQVEWHWTLDPHLPKAPKYLWNFKSWLRNIWDSLPHFKVLICYKNILARVQIVLQYLVDDEGTPRKLFWAVSILSFFATVSFLTAQGSYFISDKFKEGTEYWEVTANLIQGLQCTVVISNVKSSDIYDHFNDYQNVIDILLPKTIMDWSKQPVLTSIETFTYPVEDVQFPTITICPSR